MYFSFSRPCTEGSLGQFSRTVAGVPLCEPRSLGACVMLTMDGSLAGVLQASPKLLCMTTGDRLQMETQECPLCSACPCQTSTHALSCLGAGGGDTHGAPDLCLPPGPDLPLAHAWPGLRGTPPTLSKPACFLPGGSSCLEPCAGRGHRVCPLGRRRVLLWGPGLSV